MKITFKKHEGRLVPFSLKDRELLDSLSDGAIYEVDINNQKSRTLAQNRALHVYFNLLSEMLNNLHINYIKVVDIDLNWTPNMVKDILWKPIQKELYKKESTTYLKREQIAEVYDILNRALIEKLDIYVEFPSY